MFRKFYNFLSKVNINFHQFLHIFQQDIQEDRSYLPDSKEFCKTNTVKIIHLYKSNIQRSKIRKCLQKLYYIFQQHMRKHKKFLAKMNHHYKTYKNSVLNMFGIRHYKQHSFLRQSQDNNDYLHKQYHIQLKMVVGNILYQVSSFSKTLNLLGYMLSKQRYIIDKCGFRLICDIHYYILIGKRLLVGNNREHI